MPLEIRCFIFFTTKDNASTHRHYIARDKKTFCLLSHDFALSRNYFKCFSHPEVLIGFENVQNLFHFENYWKPQENTVHH